MKKGWFGPKEFGYGVSPKSWEGWAATVVFVLALVGWTRLLHDVHPWLWVGYATLALLFVGVIALTYEGKGYGK